MWYQSKFCERLKSKLDKHMAEAPDAQFVAEDAVYIYHKKFMVCDNLDEGSIDGDEVYHL